MRALPLRTLPKSWRLTLLSTCLLIRKNAHGKRWALQNVLMMFILRFWTRQRMGCSDHQRTRWNPFERCDNLKWTRQELRSILISWWVCPNRMNSKRYPHLGQSQQSDCRVISRMWTLQNQHSLRCWILTSQCEWQLLLAFDVQSFSWVNFVSTPLLYTHAEHLWGSRNKLKQFQKNPAASHGQKKTRLKSGVSVDGV